MNNNQNQERLLEAILDNITSKISYQQVDYYLLLKKQKNKQYCTLFVTDFCQNIWIKKVTYAYASQLRSKLRLKTDVKCFLQHLAQGLKQSSQIQIIDPYPVILVSLKISGGLIMKCSIDINDMKANIHEDRYRFKQVLKVFGSQFYDAKQYQCRQALILVDIVKQQAPEKNVINETKEREKALASRIFGKQESKIVPEKNRDLINPFRKKRKGLGMRISKQSSDQQEG